MNGLRQVLSHTYESIIYIDKDVGIIWFSLQLVW